MKRIICRLACGTAITVAGLFFCMTMILWSPSILKAQAGTAPEKQKASKVDRTEARIKELHSKLKITEAQEEQWNKLAEVMRENAATMEPLVKARQEKGPTLNAVDDLKSYSKIADAHAEGLKKFIPVFEVLYASMSDDQKKNADKIFMKHDQKRAKRK